MPESPFSNPRKHQRSEPVQLEETSQPTPKKRRLDRRSRSQTSAAFWDNVSKVWLTKRALKELDRRDSQAGTNPRPPCQRARRPVTRSLTRSNRNRHIAQYKTDPLSGCGLRVAKNIKLFARRGGPDLSDLRNYPERIRPYRTMSSSRSSRSVRFAATHSTPPTTDTPRTKSTGPYDRQFEQILIDNNIYPNSYEYPDGSIPAEPDNFEDIKRVLAQPRPSLSPSQFSDGDFRRFKRADAQAAKEKQVSESVIPTIEGNIADPRCRSGGIPFGNLDDLTDRKLTSGNPDIYYGARPEQLNRDVRNAIGGYIIPSTQDNLPIAPNFFLAAKGPDGSLAVAGRQACYDGALGARGMHSLQTYGHGEPIYDNNAYTISSTYHGGTLKMYTSHVGAPRTAGDRPETYMNQLRSFAMTDTPAAFRVGATAYRNGRDLAKERRDAAISQANEWSNRAEAEAPADDVGASPALSFVTAEESEETYAVTQESRTSLNEDLDPLGDFQESDSSIEEPAEYTFPGKRPMRQSTSQQTQRRRHNADRSSGIGDSDEYTANTPQAGVSATSSWEWDKDHQKYRYYNGTEWTWQ